MGEMATGIFPLFFLIICFLFCSSEVKEKISAEVGQDVILPCKHPNNNKTITFVKWIRSDQDPQYVLLYRSGHLDPDKQLPSYQNRVDLQDKDMKDGDVSLILMDVTKNDSGTYVCRVFQKQNMYPINIVKLEVHVSGDKFEGGKGDEGNKIGKDISRGRPGAVVSVILLLVVLASVGFLIFRRHKKKN